MAEVKPDIETFARIVVVGVGGAGSNAIDRMIESDLKGVEFLAINTDAQDLHQSKAGEKIHIGKNLSRGLGAGMNPEVGRQAAEENRDEIQEALKNSDMVFIVYGAGGGTGSGAGPIIAEAAKEAVALTVGVVTKPFTFEGKQRSVIAAESLENLKDRVDTLITIQNDKLLQVIDRNTSLVNAFSIVDDVLRQGVQGISDLITKPGIVNVDFADVNAVMQDSGSALMGIGIASGENRAVQAARSAINSPLLDISIDGANGVLFNITGGDDLSMVEVNEAAAVITENVDPNARIIFGASTGMDDNDTEKGEVKVTVVATGFDFDSGRDSQPSGNFNAEDKPKIRLSDEGDGSNQEKDEFDDFSSSKVDLGEMQAQPMKTEEKRGPTMNFESDDSRPVVPKPKKKVVKKQPIPQSDGFTGGKEGEDDDLEIPAFIRKKLGS